MKRSTRLTWSTIALGAIALALAAAPAGAQQKPNIVVILGG